MSKRTHDKIETDDKETIILLVNQVSYLERNISKLLLEVKNNQAQIIKIKDHLLDICDHDWKIDHTTISEHTPLYCNKCKCGKLCMDIRSFL